MSQKHPLQEYREERHLTLDEMGKQLGVSGVTVMRWEKRQRTPRGEELQRICAVTGIPAAKLLGVDEAAA